MRNIIFTIFTAAFFSTEVRATTYLPIPVDEAVERASIIAHISSTKIESIVVDGYFCGYFYTADVVEILKGNPRSQIIFSSRPSASNLTIGADAIVFFSEEPIWSKDEPYSSDQEYSEKRAETCNAVMPLLAELEYATMTYSAAKTKQPTDEDSEALKAVQDDPKSLKEWVDQRYMLKIPPRISATSLDGVRRISVEVVEINGQKYDSENFEWHWKVPYEFTEQILLFPVAEMKRLIRGYVTRGQAEE